MVSSKIDRYCLREARKDKAWAKRTVKNKQWMRSASEMSKEMLAERLSKSIFQLSKEKCDYLKFRACAKGKLYGSDSWIDPTARREYKRVTGRNPICRKRR